MEGINPALIVSVFTAIFLVVLFIFTFIWMPRSINKEQRELREQKLKPITVELKGVTGVNASGSNRQELISNLSADSVLKLRRRKAVDERSQTVVACLENDEIIGEIPLKLGNGLAKELANGVKIDAKINKITGGATSDSDYHVELILQRDLDD